MYKSQFKKIDPYDWFCVPGSHLCIIGLKSSLKIKETIVYHTDVHDNNNHRKYDSEMNHDSETDSQMNQTYWIPFLLLKFKDT